jgi:hypothetical protein
MPCYKSKLFSSAVAANENRPAITEVSEFATGMAMLAVHRQHSEEFNFQERRRNSPKMYMNSVCWFGGFVNAGIC